MARSAKPASLVVVSYNPSSSARDRENQRANALSHAARVAHERRRQKLFNSPPAAAGPSHHSGNALVRITKSKNPTTPRQYPDDIRRILLEPALYADLGCIQHGNSDPFNSMPVPTTAETTYQMSEWKSHLVENPLDATRPLTEAELAQDLSFDDELHGKSILFVCQAFQAVRHAQHHNPHTTLQQTKHDCLKQLESAVTLHSTAQIGATFLRILSVVFLALVLSGGTAEARAYAHKLQHLLLAGAIRTHPHEEIGIFCRMHYYDFQASLIHLHPPILSSRLTRQAWQAYMAPTDAWTQRRLPAPTVVRPPPFSSALTAIFARLQQHVDVQCEGLAMIARETSVSLLPSTAVEATSLLEALFAHRDLARRMHDAAATSAPPDPTGLAVYRWRAETALVLGALAFLACATYGPEVAGLRRRGERIMAALRAELAPEPSAAFLLGGGHRGAGGEVYEHARLWACYVGALWECECGLDLQGMWFVPLLRRTAYELGLGSWMRLKQIMDRFLNVPQAHVPGMVWFLGMVRGDKGDERRGGRASCRHLEDLVFR